LFRSELQDSNNREEIVQSLTEEGLLKDRRLLRRSLIILSLMLVGFLLQKPLGLESATIALTGAAALLIVSRLDPEKAYHEVHWTTLFFFIGLFMVVGAAKDIGIIKYIVDWAKSFVEAHPEWSSVFTVLVSAVASAVLDNIPVTATMIPVIQELGHHVSVEPLWWSLALGVGLGGNGTLIGASANLVVAGIAAKHGHPISFIYWLKYGPILMLESVFIAAPYVYLRYHVFG
jgi:Na+/H+ antiporter NhaD/arsenite permease-like protein